MEALVLFFVSLLLLVTGCVSPGASPPATQKAAAVPTLEAGATSGPACESYQLRYNGFPRPLAVIWNCENRLRFQFEFQLSGCQE